MVWQTELCPWCEQLHPARLTREAGECREWQCAGCARRWTIRDSAPGELFAFWPGDIDRAQNHGSPTPGCCPSHGREGGTSGREVQIEVHLQPSGLTLVVRFPQAGA
jgi:hypothetical protein